METLPIRRMEPSEYERRARREIEMWRQPDRMGWFGQAVEGVNRVAYGVTGLIRRVPGVDWTIDHVVAGVLRLTNEIVQDSVWTDKIYEEYRKAGIPAATGAELHALDLEVVDARLAGLDAKYRALAAAQGAAAGYAGLPGIVPDVVGLVALNLRAAGEYAAYCGFDLSAPSERLYALRLLDAVSSPSDTAKQVALSPIMRVSSRLARDGAVRSIEQLALTRAIRNAVEALGIHLTRAKLAQVVPMTGALVGSGFNAYYTSKVCDAAYFLYRERFLHRKYGLPPVEE